MLVLRLSLNKDLYFSEKMIHWILHYICLNNCCANVMCKGIAHKCCISYWILANSSEWTKATGSLFIFDRNNIQKQLLSSSLFSKWQRLTLLIKLWISMIPLARTFNFPWRNEEFLLPICLCVLTLVIHCLYWVLGEMKGNKNTIMWSPWWQVSRVQSWGLVMSHL